MSTATLASEYRAKTWGVCFADRDESSVNKAIHLQEMILKKRKPKHKARHAAMGRCGEHAAHEGVGLGTK